MLENTMPRETWVGVASSPRPNLSGGFSPMWRKSLRFMAGAAAIGGDTGLLTEGYGEGNREYETAVLKKSNMECKIPRTRGNSFLH